MRRRLATLFAAGLAVLAAATSALAAADTFTVILKRQIDITLFVPCAAGGAGEDVQLTGSFQEVFHTTLDAKGGFLITTQAHPQGVSGVGLTTGDSYQWTGVARGQLTGELTGRAEEVTFVTDFRILGQGPGNNFVLHETFHVTVNANGELTVFVDNLSVECR